MNLDVRIGGRRFVGALSLLLAPNQLCLRGASAAGVLFAAARREVFGARVSPAAARPALARACEGFENHAAFPVAAAQESRGPLGLRRALFVAALVSLVPGGFGAEMTFAERLGWKPSDVVVILHVDDVGMSHSSNLGAVEAIEKGVATSWSVMMPCSWVPEIARYLKEHPKVDSGLHLTLTSEWRLYRWGPLAGKSQVPGLVDKQGCLWPKLEQVATNASPDEIEREIRAQIERAETLGIPITHLDSHMGTMFARPEFFERFAKVGIEKEIPILCVGGHASHLNRREREAATKLKPWVKRVWNAGLPVLDDLHTGFTRLKTEKKSEKLMELLKELKPGVTEILFHASRPTEDFPVITSSSEARRADLKALTDPRVKKLIQERGIIQTTWKELIERRKKAAAME